MTAPDTQRHGIQLDSDWRAIKNNAGVAAACSGVCLIELSPLLHAATPTTAAQTTTNVSSLLLPGEFARELIALVSRGSTLHSSNAVSGSTQRRRICESMQAL